MLTAAAAAASLGSLTHPATWELHRPYMTGWIKEHFGSLNATMGASPGCLPCPARSSISS